jgi:hypothetical protein
MAARQDNIVTQGSPLIAGGGDGRQLDNRKYHSDHDALAKYADLGQLPGHQHPRLRLRLSTSSMPGLGAGSVSPPLAG